jgi:hypothetical protein
MAKTSSPVSTGALGKLATSVRQPTSPTTFSARGQRRWFAPWVNADALAMA